MSFGLVTIPIRLYSASAERPLSFTLLDKKTRSPIRYRKVRESDGREVAQADIVKGYECDNDEYVILSPEDFKRASAKKSDQMDVVAFTQEDTIDRRYYEKPYVTEPDKRSGKAYSLLRDALKKSGKVGIVRFVMHDREHIGGLKAEGRFLMLDGLRFADELRDLDEVRVPAKADYSKREFDLALHLIDSLTESFNPKEFKDTYADELRAIIRAKAKGTLKKLPKKEPEPEPTGVSDILESLRRSLERTPAH